MKKEKGKRKKEKLSVGCLPCGGHFVVARRNEKGKRKKEKGEKAAGPANRHNQSAPPFERGYGGGKHRSKLQNLPAAGCRVVPACRDVSRHRLPLTLYS